jgi:hypothetical protein
VRFIICHYENLGYRSKELAGINTLHECELCSRSRTGEQSLVPVCCVYAVSIDNIVTRLSDYRRGLD